MRPYFPPLFSGPQQRGNALYIILVGIALFAALSYAVTRSGRGGGDISKEQAINLASQITATTSDVAQGVQRLMVSGASSASLEAGPPGGATEPGTGSLNGQVDFCTTGANCIFSPTGGGITLPVMPRAAFLDTPAAPVNSWYPSYFQGTGSFNGVTLYGLSLPNVAPYFVIQGVGTAAADDVMTVYPLKKAVCQAINAGLGIPGIPTHNGSATITTLPLGQTSGCLDWSQGGGQFYDYVTVIVAH